jgi:Ca-activated chloride channel family protein
MRFELPLLVALAPAAALLAWLAVWLAGRRRARLAGAWSPRLGRLTRRGQALSGPLLAAAALFAVLGAAGPRGGRVEREATGTGLNVMLAVDISRSMLAEDGAPTRLDRAIREARRLVQDLPTDRIGVVAFAGQAHVLSPLTLDRGAIMLYLETLHPDLATAQGTQFEPLFRAAAQVLGGAVEGGDRALIVFTDGEGHDSLPAALAAARDLGRAGIRLLLVGQGEARPARIPVRDDAGVLTGYHRDGEGRIVETVRRDDIMRRLAEAAGGLVIPAETPDQAGAIRDDLRGLARRPVRERRLADLTPLGWIAALAAAMALLAQTATRRGAALAGLGILCLAAPGHALQRTGGAAFDAALTEARRTGSDTAWYNAGTAALHAGRLDDARDALERAARSLDPDLRYRALYNLGVGALVAARADSAGRDVRLAEAVRRFKEALLLMPGAEDAKWNLELAFRLQPPTAAGQPPPTGGPDTPPPSPADGLTTPEAEAILQSVDREEALTRTAAMRRQRLRAGALLKDW